jgi:NAD(P)-dependent dehydrogenase (short-subunit alcohol dehydrogenase family)
MEAIVKSAAELFDNSGPTAVVTGASSGLGVGFAETLAGAGANVVIAARRTGNIESLAESIAERGGTSVPVTCDVTDPKSVAALIDRACSEFGRVDILVNNAGVSAEAGVMPENIPDELFDQTIRTNLYGTFYCAREAARRMIRDGKGGVIINIASVAGLSGQQNFPAAYQASKAAVVNLTRNLACSWADRNIRVNCIAPGWFPSEMTAGWFGVPAFLRRFEQQAPMNRTGDLDELVGPLLFLASDASSFVTGHTLAVDGGLASLSGGLYDDELFEMQAAAVGDLGARLMPETN